MIREADLMYELADWGTPMAPRELSQQEKLVVQLPHSLVRVLRSRARVQGVSVQVLIDRLLHDAVALPRHAEADCALSAVFD